MALSKEFVLAGSAIFTIEIPETQKPHGKQDHYTFRVQHVPASERWGEKWFVQVLTGPNNTEDYTYLGILSPHTGVVTLTAKSAFNATSYRFRILNRVLNRIWADDHQAYEVHGFKVHHEGMCARCGKVLTTPESVERGLGPVCAGKISAEAEEVASGAW